MGQEEAYNKKKKRSPNGDSTRKMNQAESILEEGRPLTSSKGGEEWAKACYWKDKLLAGGYHTLTLKTEVKRHLRAQGKPDATRETRATPR